MNKKIMKNKAMIFLAAMVLPISLMSFENAEISPKGPAFSLSSEKSTVSWKGTKPGGSHYGVIEVVDGVINTEGDKITGGDFTIDMTTIINEDLTNENFNQRLVGHLMSEDFFSTEKYPKAFFKITNVTKQMSAKDGFSANHMVTGDLTIRGNTKEISFPANIKIEGDKVYAKTGEIMLDRTEWNVNFQSKKVFANLKDSYIDDTMIVSLDLNFDVN